MADRRRLDRAIAIEYQYETEAARSAEGRGRRRAGPNLGLKGAIRAKRHYTALYGQGILVETRAGASLDRGPRLNRLALRDQPDSYRNPDIRWRRVAGEHFRDVRQPALSEFRCGGRSRQRLFRG